LARSKALRPQICLLDIGLPDMDGNELARCLRSQPETATSVLIAVTGYGQEQDTKQSAEAGFDYHFVKPIDTNKLASLLARIHAA
jgi:CheY-like chemotaxis protein